MQQSEIDNLKGMFPERSSEFAASYVGGARIKGFATLRSVLSCFDTVFRRPYRYFSISLKVVFSLSDRYKIFTSNWLWFGICENVVLGKIDITMATANKKFEIDKRLILSDLDELLKIQH